ncbi:MAG: choice-of-anchor K domain-containing protein, partial [Candidatus Limnocylindrales bacterium]
MYSNTRRGPGKGTALLAVLQAILLLSALVLTPAAVIAQDADPTASHEPAVETTGEPAAEPTPEAKAEPKAEAKPEAPRRPKVGDPKVKPEPKAAVEKSLGEQGLTIRFFPQKVRVAVGGKVVVGAYLCDKSDKTPFGGAKGSGDPKDYCDPVRVKWAVDGKGATTSNTFGKKTKLTLLDDSEPIRLIATVDDLKRPTKIIVKQKAAKKRPEALSPQQVEQAKAAQQDQAPSNSNTDDDPQPKADEPKADEPKADDGDCLVDPVSGECLAELPALPRERPEAPVVEPTEEPSAAPTAEPTEEPTAEPTEEPTAEPTEEPTAEPTEEPTVEPTEEPSADDADRECLIDPVTGECVPERPERPEWPEPAEAVATEAPAEQPDEPKAEPKAAPKDVTFQSAFSVAANVPVLVEARMDSGTSDCIRYDPQDGGNSRTQWVDASETPDTAWTAHGRQGSSCPSSLSLTTQSAVGFSPTSATTVPTGVPFTLGQMTHSNNPIQGENFFNGDLGIRFFGATQTFPWQLWETPNNASPCAIPGTSQPCDDQISFSDTTGNQTIEIDGLTYQLVLLGFNNVGTGNIGDPPPACPA